MVRGVDKLKVRTLRGEGVPRKHTKVYKREGGGPKIDENERIYFLNGQ